MDDFSVEACYEVVKYEMGSGLNVFEELGRAIIRSEQDTFFNKNMILAYKQYIKDHNLKWNSK